MISLNEIAEKIDASPLNRGLRGIDWLSSNDNIPIIFDNGDVALFDGEKDEKSYEVHFLFNSRGRKAIEHAREAFRRMFFEHNADLIFGLVPHFRRDVKMLARWSGGRSMGFRLTSEGSCELFVLSKDMWKDIK